MTFTKLIFTSGAEADLKESVIWYESQRIGLGDDFVNEIDAVAIRILKNPRQFPIVLQNIHKANLKNFPFNVFFVISDNSVYVIAIFHNSRDPKIWESRTTK